MKSKSRTINPVWVAILSSAILLLCGVLSYASILTPMTIPNWGKPPTDPRPILPGYLDCSAVNSVSIGPVWRGLQIGVSSLADVRIRLAPVMAQWNTRKGHLYFDNVSYLAGNDWELVEACFYKDKLAALNITGDPQFRKTLSQWVRDNGHPQVVTWSDNYYYRSVIWGERGTLAIVDVKSELTGNVILFPSTRDEELNNFWLMQSLPSQNAPYVGDVAPLPPALDVENPWKSP